VLINSIDTTSFRNLANQTVDPGPRFNVLCGANAQGKTNFLEAVYLVACLRSFREQRSGELRRFETQEALVHAVLQLGGVTRELEVRLHPRGRRALVDGKGVRNTAAYLSSGLNVVLFTPDDVQIPRGSPRERRRLLDRAITNLWPGYLTLARDYQKTLQSRNRILRESVRQRRSMSTMLEVYDQQLCEQGARLTVARMRYLRALAPRVVQVFGEISRTGVDAALLYLAPDSVLEAGSGKEGAVRQALSRLLTQHRSQDRTRQATTVGPHTDDLDFRLDSRSARSVGSQGQHRAMVLAFKVAQIIDAHERLGDYPVLLLDDVSSELDAQRNSYLFDFINKIPCQLFLTTTRRDLVTSLDDRIDFQVVNGKITVAN